MKQDELYVRHILDAITQVETYIGAKRYEEFIVEPILVDAVIRKMEIIGEATNNLSEEFQKQHTDIPYTDIISMRNRLIHAYVEVNLEIIWNVYQNNLPALKNTLSAILTKDA